MKLGSTLDPERSNQATSAATHTLTSRRAVIACAGASAVVAGSRALAQSPTPAGPGRSPTAPPTLEQIAAALPLVRPRLDHYGLIVPDARAASLFYASLFNAEAYQEPFQGGARYTILFKRGPAETPFSYVEMGDANGRPTYMDHWCCLADIANGAAVNAAMQQIGGAGAGRLGLMDPDSIQLQGFNHPGGLAKSLSSMGDVLDGQPLFEPVRLHYVILRVANLDRSIAFYNKLFGGSEERPTPTTAWIKIGEDFLGLQQAEPGQAAAPIISGIFVKTLDRPAAERRLRQLGARIIPTSTQAGDRPGVLRFVSPFDITTDLLEA